MGATVILTGRNEVRLKESLSLLEGEGHKASCLDLTNTDARAEFIANLPTIDGLVNSAGIQKTVLFQQIKQGQLDAVLDVNFFVPVQLSQELLTKKKFSKEASIVMLSSIDGPITAHIGNSMYAASKGAITAMAKGMAIDLASRRIRVNCVLPGMTMTPMIDIDEITEEQIAADKLKYPLKRFGQPEEIAHAIIYFLSDASRWTTGSNLVVDGGFSIV
jgi:NAD(P)-dependent dehydrogenase (short-subunit alcohol dehydrogenase family)